jgi:lipoate-protein ligase A
VDSVSSPVGNILLDNERFIGNVQREFGVLYDGAGEVVELGEECLDIEEVRKGYVELSVSFAEVPESVEMANENTESRVDVYANAPIHLFRPPSETRAKGRRNRLLGCKGTLPIPHHYQPKCWQAKQFRLDVRYGAVTGCQLKAEGATIEQSERLLKLLEKKNLHEIKDWEAVFAEAGAESKEAMEMAKWVHSMLSIPSWVEDTTCTTYSLSLISHGERRDA